jgi:threonine-phosphate decarboxylase
VTENYFAHGGNLREISERFHLNMDKIIDFSSNINPLGPPPGILRWLEANLKQITRYPEAEATLLKTVMAEHLGLELPQVLVGNGAIEIIYLITQYLCPQQVLIPAPTFSEYSRAALSCGAKVMYFPLSKDKDFSLDYKALLKQAEAGQVIFLCNPNNPVGNLVSRDLLEMVIDYCYHKKIFIVIDESFLDFVVNWQDFTCRELINRYNNLLIIYSLTKFYALPGLRLGSGLGHPEVIEALAKRCYPWNVNCLAQQAGILACQDLDFADRTRKFIQYEKEYFYNQLNAIPGIRAYYPEANFIFLDISASEHTATELQEKLAQQGLLLRNCNNFPYLGEKYLRVAVKQREDNNQLLAAIQRCLIREDQE